ncbi:hypothetical protein Tcan_00560, partial [Toxocara canis]
CDSRSKYAPYSYDHHSNNQFATPSEHSGYPPNEYYQLNRQHPVTRKYNPRYNIQLHNDPSRYNSNEHYNDQRRTKHHQERLESGWFTYGGYGLYAKIDSHDIRYCIQI